MKVRGFEEAILEDSQNLDTWLIFADFLDDHDHPNAEVTRLWAKKRWWERPLGEESLARLQELLEAGRRPFLPRHRNSLGMEFVLVPKGRFWMSWSDNNAQFQVEISNDFFISVYLMTQGQWNTLMGDNPSRFSRTGSSKHKVKDISETGLARFPVERVSWNDCQTFLEKLNEGVRDSDWAYRLPKETEWEYSCRAGASTKHDCAFHFYFNSPTNELSTRHANFDDTNNPKGNVAGALFLGRTTKVGTYESNALGVYDFHGNVMEWCDDSYHSPRSRVIRGGSWASPNPVCRTAYREGNTVSYQDGYTGFRVVRVPAAR